MKKTAFTLLTIFLVVFTMLILGEIIIRIFLPQNDSLEWLSENDKYGFSNKSDFKVVYRYPEFNKSINIETNEFGHRSQPYDHNLFNDTSIVKILLLGDSYTFGLGVEIYETFGYKLQQQLNKHHEKFLVINSGVVGWGTEQELLYAIDNYSVFNPGFIILTFSENDPTDDEEFLSSHLDAEHGRFYFPGKIFIRRNSHLFRYLSLIYREFVFKRNLINLGEIKTDAGSDKPQLIFADTVWQKIRTKIELFVSKVETISPEIKILILASNPFNREIIKNLKLINNPKVQVIDVYENIVEKDIKSISLEYDVHWNQKIHSIAAELLKEKIIGLQMN